jgi:hypothetical protein
MALTPQEQREMEELEYEQLLAEQQAATQEPAPAMAPQSRLGAASGLLAGQMPNQPIPGTEAVGQFIKNAGLEGGGAALGQVAGAATGPLAPVAVPVFGGLGGMAGNVAAQITTPGKDFSFGEMMAAGAAGAVPGASLAASGGKQLAMAAGKSAAANVAAKAVQTGIDDGRMPTMTEAGVAAVSGGIAPVISKGMGGAFSPMGDINSKRNMTLAKWRDAGGKIDPAAVEKEVTGLTTLAGKEGMRQEVSVQNQRVVNRLLREDLGLSGAKPIRIDDLDYVRENANNVYQRVANISKQAATDLDSLTKARSQARDLGFAYKNSDGNYELRQKWLDAKKTVENIENIVEAHAAPRPGLYKELKKARETIAKSYDVEIALNPGNFMVDAGILAAGYDGRNMTGKLQLVADVANAFPQYVTEPSRIGAPGVSRLGAYAAGQALAQGSPAGAFAAGVPMLGKPARKLILSDVIQDWAAKPAAKTEPALNAMARISTLSAGRNTPATPSGVPSAPAAPATTYTDEQGQSHAIINVDGLGRGIIKDGKFYPVID